MDGWMEDGWVDGRMGGWIGGWVGIWTKLGGPGLADGRTDVWVYGGGEIWLTQETWMSRKVRGVEGGWTSCGHSERTADRDVWAKPRECGDVAICFSPAGKQVSKDKAPRCRCAEVRGITRGQCAEAEPTGEGGGGKIRGNCQGAICGASGTGRKMAGSGRFHSDNPGYCVENRLQGRGWRKAEKEV